MLNFNICYINLEYQLARIPSIQTVKLRIYTKQRYEIILIVDLSGPMQDVPIMTKGQNGCMTHILKM